MNFSNNINNPLFRIKKDELCKIDFTFLDENSVPLDITTFEIRVFITDKIKQEIILFYKSSLNPEVITKSPICFSVFTISTTAEMSQNVGEFTLEIDITDVDGKVHSKYEYGFDIRDSISSLPESTSINQPIS